MNNKLIEYKEPFWLKIKRFFIEKFTRHNTKNDNNNNSNTANSQVISNKITPKVMENKMDIYKVEIKQQPCQSSPNTQLNCDEDDEIFKALTEVKYILDYYDENIINKIPKDFLNFIEENLDKNYKPKINSFRNINTQSLLPQTRDILAIIYEKYIVEK